MKINNLHKSRGLSITHICRIIYLMHTLIDFYDFLTNCFPIFFIKKWTFYPGVLFEQRKNFKSCRQIQA